MSFPFRVVSFLIVVEKFHESLLEWNLRLVAENSLCSADVSATVPYISLLDNRRFFDSLSNLEHAL